MHTLHGRITYSPLLIGVLVVVIKPLLVVINVYPSSFSIAVASFLKILSSFHPFLT
jgi:hypothetical protein